MFAFLKITLCAVLLFGSAASAVAQHNHDHAKHNMLIYGVNEVFASHLVFKFPHNFQVILKVKFPESVYAEYLSQHKNNPADTYLFLLDEMAMKDLEKMEAIEGDFFRTNAEDGKTIIANNIRLEKKDFVTFDVQNKSGEVIAAQIIEDVAFANLNAGFAQLTETEDVLDWAHNFSTFQEIIS